MLIQLQDVGKTYNSKKVAFTALHTIDFAIDSGEFVVIAGPSGSGKTTLLNLVGALDLPSKGRIYFEGEDISTLTEPERAELRLREIGFVFQAYNLINVLNAIENVEYVLQLQGLDSKKRRETAMELLHAVGLEGLEKRRPEELSGGQQQRVAVARALASDPKLMLADEPTANLDQKTGRELIELMIKLNKERGITFLISSHDTMVIEHAKRVVQLLDGRIIGDESQSKQ